MSGKRASTGASPTAGEPAQSATTDIMLDPRVLQHELRHVKVRLRERSTAFEELSLINQEHVRAAQQQAVYAKRLEEVWANLEISLQALAPQLPSASDAPAVHKALDGAHARASKYANPVLDMLATRWSELSGRSVDEMKHATSLEAKAAAAKSSMAIDEGDEVGDVEEDEEDEEEEGKRASSDALTLDPELQRALDQRAAFTQMLLTSVVQQQPRDSSPANPDAARLALLQADNLSLQQRLHSSTNELHLLNASLTERDQRVESLDEKYKQLLRRFERLKVDAESGKVAAAATKAEHDAATTAMADTDVVMKHENGQCVKLDPSAAARFSAASARADSAIDTRPMSAADLSTFSTANRPAATPAVLTSSAIAKLREDLTDHVLLSERRLTELKTMKEAKTQLERDLHLARMNVLQDEAAIRTTKVFIAIHKAYEAARQDKARKQLQYEQLQARLQDEVRMRGQLQAEHTSQMEDAARRYDCSYEQATNEISELKAAVVTLQAEKDEWAASHAHEQDLASFFQKLRSDIIPDMERQLREQGVFIAQHRAEKEELERLQGAPGEQHHFARVMRVWKQQETALKAEIKALGEYVSSSSSPSAASSASSSVRAAALERENTALKQQLLDLQSSPAQDLRGEVDQLKELSHVLGEELNTLSGSHDDSQALATRLTSTLTEYTKTLDRFRNEKAQSTKLIALAKQETAIGKLKLDQLDHAMHLQVRVGKEAKTLSEQTTKENAKLREEIGQLHATVEEVRAGQLQQKQENTEFKTKYVQLMNQHGRCEEEMEELRQRDSASAASNRRVAEAHVILKTRFKALSAQAGDASGSKKSAKSAAAATSADEAVINGLKLLVSCRVCATQQKTKIIVKCGHSFCTDCLQANLDSRLRKCPQCGLRFGENDVKPIYL